MAHDTIICAAPKILSQSIPESGIHPSKIDGGLSIYSFDIDMVYGKPFLDGNM